MLVCITATAGTGVSGVTGVEGGVGGSTLLPLDDEVAVASLASFPRLSSGVVLDDVETSPNTY